MEKKITFKVPSPCEIDHEYFKKRREPSNGNELLGDHMHSLRVYCRITMRQLSDETGYSIAALADMEAGTIRPFEEVMDLLHSRKFIIDGKK